MSDKNDKPINGVDPLQRLASFKPQRDLSLGAAKPNKKVFTPNVNVTRNKKGPLVPNIHGNKREDKDRRERRNDRNRNFKNGPKIIKSTGVFSEGLGSAEKHSSRSSYYSRDNDSHSTATLQKPTIRVKDVIRIDKELEEQKIRQVVGSDTHAEFETEDFKHVTDVDAPVKLPMDDGGWSHSQNKAPVKIKQEVVVKQEPADDVYCALPTVAATSMVDVKEVYEDTSVVNLLKSEIPTLILIQFPDTLPGRGGRLDEDARRAGAPPGPSAAPAGSPKPGEQRCLLSELEEGNVGKLLLHRSGKVRISVGDHLFDMISGTKPAFHQDVVSVAVDENSRSANLICLGPIQHKLNVTPEWEHLLLRLAV